MKEMKKHMFILTLLLSSVSSFLGRAQGLYGNYYHDLDSGANIGIAITRLMDSNLFLFGGGNYLSGGATRIGGIILNSSGSTITQYHLQSQYLIRYLHSDYGTLLHQASGDYITHQTIQAPADSAKNYRTWNASIVRFHPNGDTAWVKTYTDTNLVSQAPGGLSQSSLDSSFVMSGKQVPATGTTTVGLLMFLDSAARLKRQRTYQHPGYPSNTGGYTANFIQRAAFLPDGKRVLATCGARTFHRLFNGGYYFKFHPWLFICDTQGTILKQRVMPQHYSGGGGGLFSGIDKAGGYYLSTSIDTILDPGGYPASYLNYPPCLMHLDTNLNTEWTIWFGDTSHSYLFYTVKQLRNHNFLLIGRTTLPDTPGDAGWLAVVDRGGTLKWSRRYYRSANWDHQLFDAIKNADGSITAVGYGKSDTSSFQTQSDIWVLNVDSMGCEGPGICSDDLSVEESPPVIARSDDFRVYPNPTSGALTLETTQTGDAVLYNLLGTVVWQQRLDKGATAVQLPHSLSAGVYLVRFSGKDGIISQTRLVYQP